MMVPSADGFTDRFPTAADTENNQNGLTNSNNWISLTMQILSITGFFMR